MAVKTYLLDTSAYSAFLKGEAPGLKRYFNERHRLLMPVVVVGELRAGFAAGRHQAFNEKNLQLFLNAPSVEVVGLTDRTTRSYARLFAALRAAGKLIGTNDLWIAALTAEHDCPLLTLDADFARVPGLMVAKIGGQEPRRQQ